MSAAINAIDKESVHRICSGQVVLDLATAVKELVENSLDAGATSVEVKFKDNGIEGFEVIDDGSGIDPLNYESLALKHYTSKLNKFEDLEKVLTFGFRGEALSSLCALCHFSVITATKAQAPMGVKLEYDINGVLIKKTPIARKVGTTIQLSNLFHSLPVRQQEFKRNIKKEYAKALTILQAYSIISTNVRTAVYNQAGKKSSVRVMSTSGNKELIANISNVFGASLASEIIPFKINLEEIIGEGTVEGYISKPEFKVGRGSGDRQYFFVNGRPCILPKMTRTLNEIYRSFIANQYPVIIANFKIPTDRYDVNVSPDKRTIFIHEENRIAEAIMSQLKEQLEPSRSTFEVNALMQLNSSPPVEPMRTATQVQEAKDDMELDVIRRNTSATVGGSSSSSNGLRSDYSVSSSRIGSNGTSFKSLNSFAIPGGNQFKPRAVSGLKRSAPITSSTSTSTVLDYISKKPKTAEENEEEEEEKETGGNGIENEEMETDDFVETNTMTEETETDSDILMDAQPDFDDDREYIEAVTGIKSFSGLWRTLNKCIQVPTKDPQNLLNNAATSSSSMDSLTPSPLKIEEATLKSASVKNTMDNEKATKALSRVISKPDFERMQVLGQFNLGFMIASLDDQDLYIIDQHASDEKYNFETLQQATRIKTQKLISPRLLDLTAAEELVVMDNLEIFHANGFEVEILPDNEPTKRIRIVSQPVSKNTVFDKKDFSELIFLINEHPGDMVRCSRTRAMFASRACHKATRIGDYLNKRQMTKIIRHMGEIDQPWNCPHGRPTMRHLLSLSQFRQAQPVAERRTLTFSGSLSFSK